jgi:TRAP transporter TAXI family solute receptor
MKKFTASKELLRVYGLSILLVATAFITAYQFVGPAPTKNIAIATGGRDGAYYGFGTRYAGFFERNGVELTVLETAGSIDNLNRIMEAADNVHAAMIQGGIGNPEAFPRLESLGSLYYEPLWLFHRPEAAVGTLGDLRGRRIALGSRGSGTYALAAQLLAENGVTPETAHFTDIGGRSPVESLRSETIDVLFIVAGIQSETVRSLLESDAAAVYSFRRAEAYVRNHQYLSRVVLPESSIPLLTILYPLFKIAPPTYRWRVRRKVNRYYKALHDIDLEFAAARSGDELEVLAGRLGELERKAMEVQVPAAHMEAQYALRRHIGLLRVRIERTMEQAGKESPLV